MVLNLAIGPRSKNEGSAHCADDVHQGELNRVVEEMNWQNSTVCEFNLKGDKTMLKRFLIGTTMALLVTLTAAASSDREDDVKRTEKATQVFREIMNTPDQGIPQELLETAKCIAIIPTRR